MFSWVEVCGLFEAQRVSLSLRVVGKASHFLPHYRVRPEYSPGSSSLHGLEAGSHLQKAELPGRGRGRQEAGSGPRDGVLAIRRQGPSQREAGLDGQGTRFWQSGGGIRAGKRRGEGPQRLCSGPLGGGAGQAGGGV